MKRSVRQKLRNWILKEEDSIVMNTKAAYVDSSYVRSTNFDNGLNFSIHKANGGLVVNVQHYDSTRDRSQSNLYVIPDDESIGDHLSKILTMENLKR